jgi:hypothetical protein
LPAKYGHLPQAQAQLFSQNAHPLPPSRRFSAGWGYKRDFQEFSAGSQQKNLWFILAFAKVKLYTGGFRC